VAVVQSRCSRLSRGEKRTRTTRGTCKFDALEDVWRTRRDVYCTIWFLLKVPDMRPSQSQMNIECVEKYTTRAIRKESFGPCQRTIVRSLLGWPDPHLSTAVTHSGSTAASEDTGEGRAVDDRRGVSIVRSHPAAAPGTLAASPLMTGDATR
jgi:hypothetical protein